MNKGKKKKRREGRKKIEEKRKKEKKKENEGTDKNKGQLFRVTLFIYSLHSAMYFSHSFTSVVRLYHFSRGIITSPPSSHPLNVFSFLL